MCDLMLLLTQLEGENVLPIQRKQLILERLSQNKSESITNLSALLHVSEMTVRRDLKRLENEGMVELLHGGALLLSESGFSEKEQSEGEVKRKIAQYAVEKFVTDNEIIVMEAGTTVAMMCHFLSRYKNLTILTNGLDTLHKLRKLIPASTVMSSGGILRDISHTFVGPVAEQFFKQFHPNVAFVSASGYTVRQGFTDPNMLEAHVKQAMHRSAQRRIMLMDSTKFGICSLYTTFNVSDIDILVTDKGIDEETLNELNKHHIEVHFIEE